MLPLGRPRSCTAVWRPPVLPILGAHEPEQIRAQRQRGVLSGRGRAMVRGCGWSMAQGRSRGRIVARPWRRVGRQVGVSGKDTAVMARILILTGASSTGKTTIARAVQRLVPRPTVVVAADDFDLPADAHARVAMRAAPVAEVAALQRAMFGAFYAGLAPWPAHGIGVIAETIFLDQEQPRICRQALAGLPYAIVRLVCEPAVRADRERQRLDRRPGRSRTTALSPESAAARLLPFL
jgi:chloramphenicol 3-O phosphotransferase